MLGSRSYHLDLDLDMDMDEDLAFAIAATEPPAAARPASDAHVFSEPTYTSPIPTSTGGTASFDPSLPFFFPLSPTTRSQLRPADRARAKDMFDVAREKGWWDWRAAGFCRTESEDQIRERWDREKGELTREWKRRHREATRARRRRGGVDGE